MNQTAISELLFDDVGALKPRIVNHWKIMQRYYLIEILLVLAGLALTIAVIRYPKDAFVKLPTALGRMLIRRIRWLILFPILILLFAIFYLGDKFNWKITPVIGRMIDCVSLRKE